MKFATLLVVAFAAFASAAAIANPDETESGDLDKRLLWGMFNSLHK